MPGVILKSDPTLVFGPDDSNDGPCGWTTLLSGSTPSGVLLPAQMPTVGGGGFMISTEDGSSSYNPDNYSMAIKRVTLPQNATSVTFEAWVAISANRNSSGYWNGPRALDFGLDTGWSSDASGVDNRTFYAVRYLIIDEGATGPNQRWQLKQYSGSTIYTDFTGQPTYPLGFNENKTNLMKLKMLVNLSTKKVSGFSVNGFGYGRLASTPDASLENLGAAWTSNLNQNGHASFYGGMNACVEVYNRNNVNLSKSQIFFSQPKVAIYS
jgi:hypothetical protein